MTERGGEAANKLRQSRFPLGLTLATVVAFAICAALGVWQLQRIDWKQHQLARIAELKHAAPAPIGPVLARAAKGQDVTFTPVVADCAPSPAAPAGFHLISDNGDWIARTLGACRLAAGGYDGITVDRGYLLSSRGSPNPPGATLPSPEHVVGVLYARPDPPMVGLRRPAPYVLVVRQETPAAPGVTPTPYPDATDNMQYVGADWLTWFGLAGVLACVYAAMLWRRTHPKPKR